MIATPFDNRQWSFANGGVAVHVGRVFQRQDFALHHLQFLAKMFEQNVDFGGVEHVFFPGVA
jgi:hypothetical protein